MITQWFLDAVGVFVSSVLGVFSWVQLPDVLVHPSGVISDMVSGTASLGVWIPWATLLVTVPIVLMSWLGGLGFRIFRALLSHVPGLGGSL
ncbi:MAG: hypothetical protein ACTH93_05235 [Pseudoclavibacter sp.]